MDELRKALFSMENNTSPGVDGLTTNFCNHFWPLLCDNLALVYNYMRLKLAVLRCRSDRVSYR